MKVTAEHIRNRKNVLAYIEANPEKHDQMNWWANADGEWRAHNSSQVNLCGSTMCIAGTAVFLDKSIEEFKNYVISGNALNWIQDGSEILGLEYHEASALFNNLDDKSALEELRKLAEEEPSTD